VIIQGEPIKHGLNFFFQMYRSVSVLEAYGTGWCVLGCWLSIYSMGVLFATTASRQHRMNSRSCKYIPLLASPNLQQWTNTGWPDLHEASPRLSAT
jgi:hypothetical protein